MNFPTLDHRLPLTNPVWRDTLQAKAAEVKDNYRPTKGWIWEEKDHGKDERNGRR